MASATWKRDFASGLIILLPLLVTIYVLAYLYGILAGLPLANVITPKTLTALGVPAEYNYMAQLLTFVRVVTTLAVFVLLVFSIGFGWCTTPRRWRSRPPSRGPTNSRRR